MSAEKAPSALFQLAVRGSAFTTVGLAIEQGLRLGGNLILTRLLFPEAFGLMSLVSVVLTGLERLSEVGIRQSIIRSERDDADYLNTAWTLQILRGIALASLAMLAAGPVADFYGAPELAGLIAVAGLAAVAGGLASTRLFTLNRQLALGRQTAIEIGSQLCSLALMVVWALLDPSPTVWILVAGPLTGSVIRAVLTYIAVPGIRQRLRWEPRAAHSLLHFGKWLILTSAVSFLAMQGDRLLLGRLVSVEFLGIYSIAHFVSDAASQAVRRISQRVLYPAFGEIARNQPDALAAVYWRARRYLDLSILPAASVLAFAGGHLIEFLYDDRYIEAGWMLRILSVRIALSSILPPANMCLLALGNPRYNLVGNVARAAWVFVALPLGFEFAGMTGAVIAIAASDAARLPFLWWGLHRYGLLSLRRELLRLCWIPAAALLAGLGFSVDG